MDKRFVKAKLQIHTCLKIKTKNVAQNNFCDEFFTLFIEFIPMNFFIFFEFKLSMERISFEVFGVWTLAFRMLIIIFVFFIFTSRDVYWKRKRNIFRFIQLAFCGEKSKIGWETQNLKYTACHWLIHVEVWFVQRAVFKNAFSTKKKI